MAFLPLTIVNFIAALFLPRLTEKIGNARVMLIGQIILLFGLILSALTNTMHQLGGPVGLSIVVLFTSNLAGNLTTYYHAVMWFVVGFMVLGLAVVLFGMEKRADKNK
jgi:MFS family permease